MTDTPDAHPFSPCCKDLATALSFPAGRHFFIEDGKLKLLVARTPLQGGGEAELENALVWARAPDTGHDPDWQGRLAPNDGVTRRPSGTGSRASRRLALSAIRFVPQIHRLALPRRFLDHQVAG